MSTTDPLKEAIQACDEYDGPFSEESAGRVLRTSACVVCGEPSRPRSNTCSEAHRRIVAGFGQEWPVLQPSCRRWELKKIATGAPYLNI